MTNPKDSSMSDPGGISRRQLLQLTGTGLIGLEAGLLGAASPGIAQAAAGAAKTAAKKARPAATDPAAIAPLNRFPRMVQSYFTNYVRGAEQIGEKARAALKTKEDAEQYVATVRRKILESFGPLPEKTPLEPRITGTVDRDTYKIEKVIFESRPGYLVAGNLYIPKGRKFPLPAVVGTCGHSDTGKAQLTYQSFAQGLARLGFIVLIIDPVGQGERVQYPDGKGKSKIGIGVKEHLYMGNQQSLVGEFLGSWFAWDGIRALDYLLTREEVDPKRIGVTGSSGGGTQTTWLCGLEQRWAMAAPSCFVTTFRRNMENELPADTEQCPPRALALGLDHSDFIAAMAPKPVILLAKEADFFDVRGTQEAFARLKRLYGLLGAEDKIELCITPGEHAYSQGSREAMYRWFHRASGLEAPAGEPALTIEDDKTLWCTPNGSVAELGSKTLCSFTKEKSQRLARSRRPVTGEALTRALAWALKLPPRKGVPEFNILRTVARRQYPAVRPQPTCYAVETEAGITALVTRLSDKAHIARPPQAPGRAVLYIANESSDAELREEALVGELLKAEAGAEFFACDVRGIGESRPNTCGIDTFKDPYGCDFFYAVHAQMLGRPYVGQRTHDVLRVIDWLRSFGHEEVHLAASGWGTLPALFAALLSPQVVQVTLKNAPNAYAEMAENEEYNAPLSALLPGVLARFDLPDCYKALEAKKLRRV